MRYKDVDVDVDDAVFLNLRNIGLVAVVQLKHNKSVSAAAVAGFPDKKD